MSPRTTVVALAAAVAALAAAAPAGAALPPQVQLGLVASQTGSGAPFGETQVLGAQMAADDLTLAGALGPDVRLTVAVRDDASTPAGATAAFAALADEGAVALLGPTLSGVARASQPVAAQRGLPIIAVSNTADGITSAGPRVFRASLAEAAQVPATVRTALQLHALRRPAMLFRRDEAFAASGAAAFRRALTSAGRRLVADIGYTGAEPDGAALARRLVRANPDAIVVEGLSESVAVLEAIQAEPRLRDLPVLGGNALNSPGLIAQAGAAAEGLLVSAAWHPGLRSAAARDFVGRYRARYDKTPDLFAAQAYAGVQLVARAIARTQSTDPALVAGALAAMSGEPTLLGELRFDGNRDAVYPPVTQEVRRGRLVPVGAAADVPGPQAGRVAFTSDRLGSFDLFSAGPDGLGVLRLTDRPSSDRRPAFSPDGRRIAFQSDRDGNPEIYVAAADGTGVRRMTNDPADDFNPAWSPDGREIAFNSNRTGDYELYAVDADAPAQVRRLTFAPGVDSVPTWSPDGEQLAFESNRSGQADVYVMDRDGSGQTNLTPDRANDLSPAWSPDGTQIAFASDRDGQLDVFRMRADGTGATNVTRDPANDRTPTWSPDGRTIAFASNRLGTFDVWAMDRDGGTLRVLAASPQTDSLPAFSRLLEAGACTNPNAGTGRDDVLLGTVAGDALRGGDGDDRLTGLAGEDCLTGGRGDDALDGGPGRDTLEGGSGDDVLNARDGRPDDVRCGPGFDRVTVDRLDRVTGCEAVRRT